MRQQALDQQANAQAQQAMAHQQSIAANVYGNQLQYLQSLNQNAATNAWHQANLANNAQQAELDRQNHLQLAQQTAQNQAAAQDAMAGRAVDDDFRTFSAKVGEQQQQLKAAGKQWDQRGIDEAFAAYTQTLKDPKANAAAKQEMYFKQAQKIQGLLDSAWPDPNGPPKSPQQELEDIRVEKPLPNGDVEVWRRTPQRNGGTSMDYSHTIRPDGTDAKQQAQQEAVISKSLATALVAIAKEKDEATGEPISQEEFNRRANMIEDRLRGRRPEAPPPPPPGQATAANAQPQYDPSIDPGINLPPRAKIGYLKDTIKNSANPLHAPYGMATIAKVVPTLSIDQHRALLADAEHGGATPEIVSLLQRELLARDDATPQDAKRVAGSKTAKATDVSGLHSHDKEVVLKNLPTISTTKEWAALPSGAKYIADGKVWTKQ